jgi:outer membrane biosynthesis protein TonB
VKAIRFPLPATVPLAVLAIVLAMAALSLAAPGSGGGKPGSADGTLGSRQLAGKRHGHRLRRLGAARPVGGEPRGTGVEPVAPAPSAAYTAHVRLTEAVPAPAAAAAPQPQAAGKTPSAVPPESSPPAPAPEPAPEIPPAPAPEIPPPPAPQPAPEVPPPDIDPAVVANPAPVPDGSFVLGIDGGYSGWSSAEVNRRTQLGAAVTRHEWDPSNPATSEEEQVLAAATEIHTRIQALLGGNDLGDPTHYGEWVVEFVRYYGPGGTFWRQHPQLDASRYAIDTIELGNEPYFGTMSASSYADTVRPTLERIRELKLPVKVILPSYVYGSDTSWIDTLYEHIPNLNAMYDALAFHPYWYGHDPAASGPGGPFERIETLRQRMNELGASSKPIFLTEYGESTANCGSECVSEAVQAEHIGEMIDAVVSHPGWKVGMLSIFQLSDFATNSPNRERQFGLLREDGTPKLSYQAVRAAMQLYR